MTDNEAAAAAVLAEVMPIGPDDSRVVDFGQAVVEDIAVRPSPTPPPDAVDPVVAALQLIAGQLTTIIHQNAALIDMHGKAETP